MKRIALLLLLGASVARADDTSPASNTARQAVVDTWKQIKTTVEKRDLAGFVELASPRYRQTTGENAYTFFPFALQRRFTWGVATVKYKDRHAALLVETASGGRKWTIAVLMDRVDGSWKMDGLADLPTIAEAYVENGKPLELAKPAPPGSPRAADNELDTAYRALHNALFWGDKKAFMAMCTKRWQTAFANSAPYFWKSFADEPIMYVNPRLNVRGDRGAVVVDVTQDGVPTSSIGILFVLTPKGFRADGLATNEKQTLAYLHGSALPK